MQQSTFTESSDSKTTDKTESSRLLPRDNDIKQEQPNYQSLESYLDLTLEKKNGHCYYTPVWIFILGAMVNSAGVTFLTLTDSIMGKNHADLRKKFYVGGFILVAVVGIILMYLAYRLTKNKPVGTPSPRQQASFINQSAISSSNDDETNADENRNETEQLRNETVSHLKLTLSKKSGRRCYMPDGIFILGAMVNSAGVTFLTLTDSIMGKNHADLRKKFYVGGFILVAVVGIILMYWAYRLAKNKPVGTPSPRQQTSFMGQSAISSSNDDETNVDENKNETEQPLAQIIRQ